MKENIIHHTYQLKQDRAYRVVPKQLHDTEKIKLSWASRAAKAVKSGITKEALSIFFVDLEPTTNNM